MEEKILSLGASTSGQNGETDWGMSGNPTLGNDSQDAQNTDGDQEQLSMVSDKPQSSCSRFDAAESGQSHAEAAGEDGATEGKSAQEVWDQDEELRALGISVVDQLTLERDVEAAVDKAVAQHTRKQRLQILKKEVKDLTVTIKQGDNKLQDLNNRLAGMRQRLVDPKMYFGVEAEVRNKIQELITLRARLKSLQEKLIAAEDNQEELDDFALEDGEIVDDEEEGENNEVEASVSGSERERLIREGQMTPFGTTVNSASSKTVLAPPWPGLPPGVETQGTATTGRDKAMKKGPTKAELISSGEMTPFGTVVKSTSSSTVTAKKSSDKPGGGMSDFEKYLQDQINRQKTHSELSKGSKHKKSSGDPGYGLAKKKRGKLKEYKGPYDGEDGDEDVVSLSSIKKRVKAEFESSKSKPSSSGTTPKKDPLKKHILHPKKKTKEKPLGSVTSSLEADMYKATPRRVLSERVSLEDSEPEDYDMEGSGSEYVPSDKEDEDYSEDNEVCEEESEGTSDSPRKSDRMKKTERKAKRRRKGGDKSEDELMDDYLPKPKKMKSCKSRDDGNVGEYIRRIEEWKEERLKRKHIKILRGDDLDSEEEEEEGYEEFDGGFRVPLSIWNKLYKYQRTCVRWLWELHCQGCGGILGDEMGLGKTIQVISFLVGLSYSRLRSRYHTWRGLGPVLVVCPATVLHQWVKEFHKWWPPFRVAVMHESGTFTGTRPALIGNINRDGGILITSYTGVRDQLEILLQHEWHYIVLDEGHKIRNPEAQITVALKRFTTPHRLILSGSPIQNNLKELWSLFDFVFPGKLGTLPVFLQQFSVPITQGGYANASKLEVQTAFKCASMLRDTINPYLLRRMKNDVRQHLSLPDKNEQVLFCGLSDEQRKIYQEYISSEQVNKILGGRLKVFVGLINLRKICNHPDLFTGGPHGMDENWESGLQPELRYGWWSRSGKMHVLKSVLQLWSRQGHRVLLFTQSRQMMCILERFLMDEHHTYLKMDGATTVSSRQPLIDKFNQDPSYFVFLLTTRVGGLGVNLTGADRVVIFDPDWNPSTDTQARERAWRIGQMRHVTIYRLLTAGTIEEKIYHRQIFKQFLTNRVLKDPKQQRFFKTNDLYELFSFTEGEKEKTESSAIFAGTGSEIKVERRGKDEGEEEVMDVDTTPGERKPLEANTKPMQQSHKQASTPKKGVGGKNSKNLVEKEERKNIKKSKEKSSGNKSEGESSISQSISREERMRELARKLSQKIGNKTIQKSDTNTDTKTETYDKKPSPVSPKEDSVQLEVVNSTSEAIEKDSVNSSNNDHELATVKEEVSEEMPQELSDSKLEKPSGVTGENTDHDNKEGECDDIFVGKTKDSPPGQTFTDTGNTVEEEKNVNIETVKPSERNLAAKKAELEENTCQSSQSCPSTSSSILKQALLEGSHTSKQKHKKQHRDRDKGDRKEKHKHKKGKKFEGMHIEYLVKKRKYKKTEEEEEAEKNDPKSQDQYVLEKLFKKSGVHTALSHDVIISNSDPDYLLMEGEAERVAKEALKAVRASRAFCSRPRLSMDSPADNKKPRFGKKKSRFFADAKTENEAKEKKNKPMFNGGIDDDDDDDIDGKISDENRAFTPLKKSKSTSEGSSGVITSSQLLSRMRARNRGIALDSDEEKEEDYDPDYPSTAPPPEKDVEPEVQRNIDLLADIRNFVAFQAEVDGRASTQEIIDRFRERLPPEQTPYFKALLTEICDFHREVSGKGMWSLKGEFR